MKLYIWNFVALLLVGGAWLTVRLSYLILPKSWDAAPFYLGLLVYLLAYVALGWGVIQAVWGAVHKSLSWGTSLLFVGISVVEAIVMLFAFLFILAEGFTGRSS